ncbi:MAG: hypothetical protein V3R90_11950 [Limibaculum sp.]
MIQIALLQTMPEMRDPSISRSEGQGKYSVMSAMSEAKPILPKGQ